MRAEYNSHSNSEVQLFKAILGTIFMLKYVTKFMQFTVYLCILVLRALALL